MSVPGVALGTELEGRYRVAEVIGVGGMSTVYRARDEALQRDVAVKVFPPTDSAGEQERQRAEISVLARLAHPGLVAMLDAGAAGAGIGGQTYIVMELVEGPVLADVLAAGPLSGSQAAGVGAQLAEALVAVHDAGIVHRDVKPGNVLVADARWDRGSEAVPAVKLADFGIARVVDAARLTATGTTLGTATYLSPEQAAGAAVGPASDVYSLGLVLLECLTGRKAFTGTVLEVVAARLTADPAIPRALDEPWVSLLEGMTRREPAERPPMPEVARRLVVLATGTEPTLVLAGAAPPPAATVSAATVSAATMPLPVAARWSGPRGGADRPGAPRRGRRGGRAVGVWAAVALTAGAVAAVALVPDRDGTPAPGATDGRLGGKLAGVAAVRVESPPPSPASAAEGDPGAERPAKADRPEPPGRRDGPGDGPPRERGHDDGPGRGAGAGPGRGR